MRAGEADVFHTRQQHTLKVAQVGRRLAQRCFRDQAQSCAALGVDENVVEAACLSHDLGHPPFGHIGEHALDHLTVKAGDPDGFEGNAQSFRVLTKLAVRFQEGSGLDLTRAVLAACVKYPWLRDSGDPNKRTKWGAFRCDIEDFQFARYGLKDEWKTAEAEMMDWADDIAYSVHDLEDFHRCRGIPWLAIFDGSAGERLIAGAIKRWHAGPHDAEGRLREAMRRLKSVFFGSFRALMHEPYEASREQRQQLRTMTSTLTARYITAFNLKAENEIDPSGKNVAISDKEADEVKVLKQITWDYIINSPSLVAQQAGQERIIKSLYWSIFRKSKDGYPAFLPTRLRYLWDLQSNSVPRFTADCIASLTESEATGLYSRLQGLSSGSVLDPIVR